VFKDLSCWVGVVFLGFLEFFVFLLLWYFYTQALKGGRVLLKKGVWVGVEMAIETKVFQFSEVQTHGSPTDCWLIIHGKVGSFVHHHHHPPKKNSFKFFLQTHVCMCLGLFVCLVGYFFYLAFLFGVYHKL
jgi:hypothetical protein